MGREAKLKQAKKVLREFASRTDDRLTRFDSKRNAKAQLTRKFTGKTENFTDNTEKHFFQRMIRAYLRGAEYFTFGIDRETNKPMTFKVAQELK